MWTETLSGQGKIGGRNCDMDEISWHRRKSRCQKEKTNLVLESWKSPVYSKNPGLVFMERYYEPQKHTAIPDEQRTAFHLYNPEPWTISASFCMRPNTDHYFGLYTRTR